MRSTTDVLQEVNSIASVNCVGQMCVKLMQMIFPDVPKHGDRCLITLY